MKVLGINIIPADINPCEFQMTSGWQPTASQSYQQAQPGCLETQP